MQQVHASSAVDMLCNIGGSCYNSSPSINSNDEEEVVLLRHRRVLFRMHSTSIACAVQLLARFIRERTTVSVPTHLSATFSSSCFSELHDSMEFFGKEILLYLNIS